MRLEEFPTTEHLDSYDWKEMLGRNDGDSGGHHYGTWQPEYAVSAVLGDGTVPKPTAEDVIAVIAFDAESAGGNPCHELDFVALLGLTDDRYALLEAWTDCTGWGCQDGVRWIVGTRHQVHGWLTDTQRERLNLPA